jgi:hypothetical protein
VVAAYGDQAIVMFIVLERDVAEWLQKELG